MGIDPRPVATSREEKSIGREITFFDNVSDRAELEQVLLSQAHDTARRLRARGLFAGSVAIKVRFADFTTISRSAMLSQPTFVARELYDQARRLLEAVRISDPGLRLLGLRAENLSTGDGGIQLAWDDDPRRAEAETVMDLVGEKFGAGAIAPASLLGKKQYVRAPGRHELGASRREDEDNG